MRTSKHQKGVCSVLDKFVGFKFTPHILLLLLSLLVFTWFGGDSFISGGDFSWPLTFSGFYDSASHVWDSTASTGYNSPRQLIYLPTFALPGFLSELAGIDSALFERIYFFVGFFAAGIGTFLLLRAFKFNRIASFFGALIYLFNPYTLSVIWVPKAGNHIAFFCFLPLAAYTALLFIRNKQAKFLLAHLLVIFFSMATFANPAFFIPYGIVILAILLSEHLFISRISIPHLVVFAIATLAVLSYWLLPFLTSFNESFSSASNANLNDVTDDELLKLNSVRVVDAFRADGAWPVQGGENQEYYYQWHELFLNPAYIFLSFILTSLALLPLLLNFERKRLLLFWAAFFLLAILLNNAYKDDGSFLKEINKLFFDNEFVARALRNVYAKLAVLLVIPLSFMTAYFIDVVTKKKNRNCLLVVIPIALYIITLSTPFINGTIIRDSSNYLPGDKFTIPPSYYEFKNYDAYQNQNFRYFELPFPRTYNYRLVWNDSNKYGGASFLKSFTDKPVVFVNMNDVVSTVPCTTNKQELYRLFSLLNVKEVFLHEDVDPRVPDNYLCYSNLNSISKMVSNLPSRQYDQFVVYTIPREYQLPRVYSANMTILASNPSESLQDVLNYSDYSLRSVVYLNVSRTSEAYGLLSSLPSAFTTKKPRIVTANTETQTAYQVTEFKKISPSKYRVRIHHSSASFPLVFSESFHNGWKAYPTVTKHSQNPTIPSDYNILEGNQDVQATYEEVGEFIQDGYISALGGNEKFISKNIQGTIQNDNLPDGEFYETWLEQPLPEENHILANGYANSWIVEPKTVCAETNSCTVNPDGTYDFELVIDFWPERLFIIGLSISILTLLVCLAFSLLEWRNEK